MPRQWKKSNKNQWMIIFKDWFIDAALQCLIRNNSQSLHQGCRIMRTSASFDWKLHNKQTPIRKCNTMVLLKMVSVNSKWVMIIYYCIFHIFQFIRNNVYCLSSAMFLLDSEAADCWLIKILLWYPSCLSISKDWGQTRENKYSTSHIL